MYTDNLIPGKNCNQIETYGVSQTLILVFTTISEYKYKHKHDGSEDAHSTREDT